MYTTIFNIPTLIKANLNQAEKFPRHIAKQYARCEKGRKKKKMEQQKLDKNRGKKK